MVKVAGVDHVGLGSDFDGIDCSPQGIDSAADLPKITQALYDRGYKAADLDKILGGNLMRVFAEVEKRGETDSGGNQSGHAPRNCAHRSTATAERMDDSFHWEGFMRNVLAAILCLSLTGLAGARPRVPVQPRSNMQPLKRALRQRTASRRSRRPSSKPRRATSPAHCFPIKRR